MGYFVKKDIHGNEGLVLPSGPTAERPITPIEGALRYNTDTESMEYFNGTIFVNVAKSGIADTSFSKFVGDGVTTAFVMAISYTDASKVLVFLDGIYQTPPANFTVSGFNITFTSPVPVGIDITVMHGLGSTYVGSGNVFDISS